ncbi:hypothetical protein [Streptomyces sp. NPDC004230]
MTAGPTNQAPPHPPHPHSLNLQGTAIAANQKEGPTVFFRRKPQGAPQRRIEYVPLSLAELQVYERVILGAEALVRRRRSDIIGCDGYTTEMIGHLYERVGAASVHTADAARVRIPLQKAEIYWLETAVKDFDFYNGSQELAREGRQLLWRLHALLGRERAVIHAGGTPMFDPESPAAVLVDDDGQAVPVSVAQMLGVRH